VVEHDMDFMRRFATRVTVLHQGKVLSHGTVAEVQADPKVQEVYLGTAGAATTAAMSVVPVVAAGRLASSPEVAAGTQKQKED
jgi:urea transport system ATP-binding protein